LTFHNNQQHPGAAGADQETPGDNRTTQKQPGAARNSQEQPGAARSRSQQPGAKMYFGRTWQQFDAAAWTGIRLFLSCMPSLHYFCVFARKLWRRQRLLEMRHS